MLVDAVETRHRWLLSVRRAAAAKRANHESVAHTSRCVQKSRTVFYSLLEEPPGRILPVFFFFFFFDEVLFFVLLPKDNVFLGKKCQPQGALTEDIITVLIVYIVDDPYFFCLSVLGGLRCGTLAPIYLIVYICT